MGSGVSPNGGVMPILRTIFYFLEKVRHRFKCRAQHWADVANLGTCF